MGPASSMGWSGFTAQKREEKKQKVQFGTTNGALLMNSAMPVDEALLDKQAESWESTEEARQQAYTAFLFARQSKRIASAAAANQVELLIFTVAFLILLHSYFFLQNAPLP